MRPLVKPLPRYAGLEYMPIMLGGTLYTVQADGDIAPFIGFTRRFRTILDEISQRCSVKPQRFHLGTVLPASTRTEETPWRHSASLLFNKRTFSRLRALEAMFSDLVNHNNLETFCITREMSAYAGMRRLTMYGLLLGYKPLLTLTESGELGVMDLTGPEEDTQWQNFHHHLRTLSLASLLSTKRQERAFVNRLFQVYDAAKSN